MSTATRVPYSTVCSVKLTRDDWVEAAFEALLRGGPKAIAVANLAEELGATRGSFYHYFEDRHELLVAALDRWEQEATEAFIDRASSETDPAARLHHLFAQVFREPTSLATVERHLLAARTETTTVATVVDRVVSRRKAFLADCYQALGYNRADAQGRALVAYMLFTGWLYLYPDESPPTNASGRRVAAIVDEILLAGH